MLQIYAENRIIHMPFIILIRCLKTENIKDKNLTISYIKLRKHLLTSLLSRLLSNYKSCGLSSALKLSISELTQTKYFKCSNNLSLSRTKATIKSHKALVAYNFPKINAVS